MIKLLRVCVVLLVSLGTWFVGTSTAMAGSGPTNLTFVSATAHSMTVSWTQPSDMNGVTSMSVTLTPQNDPTHGISDVVSATATSDTVTGLARATSYTVVVDALNSSGQSFGSSNSIVASTSAYEAPTDLHVTSSTSTTISVAWMAPADLTGISGVSIEATLAGTNQLVYEVVGPSATSATLTGLQPSSTYSIVAHSMNAANADVSSASSNTIQAATAAAPSGAGSQAGPVPLPASAITSFGRKFGAAVHGKAVAVVGASGDGVSIAYTWLLSGKVAHYGASYRIPKRAKGKKLTVQVAFSKPGYLSVTKTLSFGKVK